MSYYEERTYSNVTGNAYSNGSESVTYSNEESGAYSAINRTNQIVADLLSGAINGVSAGSGAYTYSSYGSGAATAGSNVAYGATTSYSTGASYGVSSGGVVSSGNGYSNNVSYNASSGSSSGAGVSVYTSEVENAILRSSIPIQINESEEITVNGQRGIWANRAEVVNWRGAVPITEYQINQDQNPELITKKSEQNLEYVQELAVRYLRPPTPPAPGEILIQQQQNLLTAPAPPLIIRQQPARPSTPEPLVVREAPPQAPAQVGRKVITISGKRIPPPPRKVIIERLAPLPAKPQSVIVERWLPYAQVKRRVIFQRPTEADPVVVKPRNVIVQWEAPSVSVKKEVKYLGVIRANPAEYVQRYGSSLKQSNQLPTIVNEIATPDGLVLAANYRYNNLPELEGDLQALRLVDLDREGLTEYRSYLQRLGISYDANASASAITSSFGGVSTSGANASVNASASYGVSYNSSYGAGVSYGAELSSTSRGSISAIAEEIFNSLNRDGDNRISYSEAESGLLRLNSRLGRAYGEDDVRAFFSALDLNADGYLDFDEFRRAFYAFFGSL